MGHLYLVKIGLYISIPLIGISLIVTFLIISSICNKMELKLKIKEYNLYSKWKQQENKFKIGYIFWIIFVGGIALICGGIIIIAINWLNQGNMIFYFVIPKWFILSIIGMFMVGIGVGLVMGMCASHNYIYFKKYVKVNSIEKEYEKVI